MTWRYLPFQHYNPYYKTGLNKAIIQAVNQKKVEPTVFLSGWNPGCVNLGRSQNFEEEVNVGNFEASDYVLVRRQGGGGATLLTEKGEITWGIVDYKKNYPDDVNKIYNQVCGKIAEKLSQRGINARHEPINDIVTDNGKLSGSTIKQEKDTVYIGGTLLYEVNAEEMFSILTPNKDKLKDKQIKDFRERVTSISKETSFSFDEAVQMLKEILLEDKNYTREQITGWEDKKAQKYADKYQQEEWLYQQ